MVGGRGTGRGKGGRGGNFKPNQKSVLDRLGNIATYPRPNERGMERGGGGGGSSKKYKFVRPNQATITSSIATVPSDGRIRMLTKRFLKSYYDIFDQPGRPNLESQYSADAFFSLSATCSNLVSTSPPTFGRNLVNVQSPEDRIKLLFHDKTNIAGALSRFSPTEHLVNFLSSDVPFYIVNPMSVISMQIIVTGVFKDTSKTSNPLTAFTRVFVLKQVSTDDQGEPVYEIFNDLFMLQPPTPDQIKRYHHDSQIVKRMSGNHQDRSNSSTTGNSSRSQEDIINHIMTKTRMNRDASLQLLKENNWDEAKSIEVFNQLFAANQIPQELFAP